MRNRDPLAQLTLQVIIALLYAAWASSWWAASLWGCDGGNSGLLWIFPIIGFVPVVGDFVFDVNNTPSGNPFYKISDLFCFLGVRLFHLVHASGWWAASLWGYGEELWQLWLPPAIQTFVTLFVLVLFVVSHWDD